MLQYTWDLISEVSPYKKDFQHKVLHVKQIAIHSHKVPKEEKFLIV